MNALPESRLRRLIGLALVLLTLMVFAQVVGFRFVMLDDGHYVVNNPNIQEGLTPKSVAWAFRTTYAWYWLPVTWLSFMLDYAFFGLDPWGYHLTNLVLHTVNVWLLFLVFLELTGSLSKSALVAALFAVHPLHVESVAWVTERKDVLSTFFGMLAIMAYLRYVRRPGLRRYFLVVIALALGLMSKPMLVSWPIILLLLDYWPLRRLVTDQGECNWISCIGEKIPLAALAAISCFITLLVQRDAMDLMVDYSIGWRVASTLLAYQKYLVMTFLPMGLACFYPYPVGLNRGEVGLAGLLLAGISVLVAVKSGRYRYLATGWLWFVVSLLPVIGLVQVGQQAMADRYTYIPLTGIFVMVVWGGPDFIRWKLPGLLGSATGRTFLRWGLGVVIGVLAICAWVQTGYWKNGFVLFERALQVTEDNWFIHKNLGMVLWETGRSPKAEEHLRKVIEIRPEWAEAHYNLGVVLAEQGRPQEARVHFDDALRLNPDFSQAHDSLAVLLEQQGRNDAALAHFCRALQLDPDSAETHYNLGNVLAQLGKTDEAILHFREALRLKNDFFAAHYNWGVVLSRLGRKDEAEAHFTRAIGVNPGFLEARYDLGRLLAEQGRDRQAIFHFHKILQLNSQYLPALDHLAWLLATSQAAEVRNGNEAVRWAGRACELTGRKQPQPLCVLAAAYAEAGRYPEAVATAQAAIVLYREQGKVNRVKEVEGQLALYRARRPCRGIVLPEE